MSRTRTGKASPKPSRAGITRFEGNARELDGKVYRPGALEIAQWEGLQLKWSYEPIGEIVVLYLVEGDSISDPVLRIPLTEDEAQIFHDLREKGGWGYYELEVEENDDRAAVNVSFITASQGPVSLLWIIDKKRRTAVRRAMDRFVGLSDPIFGKQ